MTREFLLRASIAEFKDKKHKVLQVPFKRVFTKEGYSYLVLDRLKSKEIECAIHFTREYVVTEEIGRLHTTTLDFSTREKVDIPNTLFIYKGMDTNPENDEFCGNKDMVIFCKSFDGYNETMKQFMYAAEALTLDKIPLLEPIHDVFGYTSFDIISQIPGYNILPTYAFIEDKIKEGVILLNIEGSEPISLVDYNAHNQNYKQAIYEDVSFNLVHISRLEIARFIDRLYEYSLSSGKFGICSQTKVEEFADLQEAAALRGQAVKVSLRVSYAIDIGETEKFESYIRDVVWKCNDSIFDTFTKDKEN